MASTSGAEDLKGAFKNFATKANNTEATSKDMTKWFKDSGLFGKKCTSNSLDIAYHAVKGKKPGMTVDMIPDLIGRLAKDYAKDKKCSEVEARQEMMGKLSVGEKEYENVTGVSKTGAVDRMTDHTKYTGSHKERFDEDGKGKGLDGRYNLVDGSKIGYVGNYKMAGTYDKRH